VDRILVGGERADVIPEEGEGVLIDVRAVHAPQLGPATIYRLERRQFPRSGVDLGELIDWPGAEAAQEEADPDAGDSMPFFMGPIPYTELIGILDGSVSSEGLRELGEQLDYLPPVLVRAFAESFAREVFGLDSPENALYVDDDVAQGIDQQRSLASRVLVVVQGDDADSEVLVGSRPTPRDPDLGALELVKMIHAKVADRCGEPFKPYHPLEAATNALLWGPGTGRVRLSPRERWRLSAPYAGPFSEQADMFDGGGKTVSSFRWGVERDDGTLEERVGVVLEASVHRAGRRAIEYIRAQHAAEGSRRIVLLGRIDEYHMQRFIAGSHVAQLTVDAAADGDLDEMARVVTDADDGARYPADPKEARARTESLAMEPQEFWAAIALLGGKCTEDSIEAITEMLSNESVDRIIAFEASLTLALFDLDTRAAFEWYEAHDPDAESVGVSDDVFLHARCATVASGREVWERARAEGTVEATGDAESAEDLLFVASNAAGVDLDEWHPDVVPLSYETGENATGWTAGKESPATT
jgi:hypothetical protein